MELSPRSMISTKALYIRLKYILLQVIARSGFLSAAYYSFLSITYSRERRAVAAGLLHHLKRLKTNASFLTFVGISTVLKKAWSCLNAGRYLLWNTLVKQ